MAKSDEILEKIGGLNTSVGVLTAQVTTLDKHIEVCNKGIAAQVTNNKEQWRAINRQENKSVKVEARHEEEDKRAEAEHKKKNRVENNLGRKFVIYAALIGVAGAIVVGVILKVV